jgi:penicillin-binding protein 1A
LPAPGCITLQSNGAPWPVCNADPGEGAPGGTNLVEGTVHSFNTLYAQLVQQVGAQNAVDMANQLGVAEKLKPFDSAVLGSNDVTVLSMASAYGTFANRGVHVPPVMVTKITTADGTIIYESEHKPTKAIDVGVADTVTSVLQQVIQRGTGTAAQEPFPVAGKTGTGEDYKNAWFCGYTTTLATAVWVGFPDAEVKMSPPTTSITVYGGTWPAQIWQRFMAAAYANGPPGDFAAPPPPTTTTTVPGETTTIPGDAQVAVPSVVGMRSGDAGATLQQAGFRVALYPVATDSVNPDTVVAQSPLGGGQAPPGAIVTVEVAQATGKAVTVPNVFGMSEQSARDTLHQAGLSAISVTKQSPDPGPQGTVWSQSPEAGAQVPPHSSVTIYINP